MVVEEEDDSDDNGDDNGDVFYLRKMEAMYMSHHTCTVMNTQAEQVDKTIH